MSDQGAGIKSFVIRSGRMTDLQKAKYEELMPRYGLPDAPLVPEAAFGRRAPLVLEVGFGMGAATIEIAAAAPDRDFLGIEVHRAGIGKLLSEAEARGLANVRVFEGDAVEYARRNIAPASLDGFHLFFPDPWPKKRHHKRRIVQAPFAELVAERLKPGGYFYMVTDWLEYAEWALEVLAACPLLENVYPGFAERQPWRPLTKFERRGYAEGRPPSELFFRRRA